MLETPAWVAILERVARMQAESQEAEASRMARARWISWLNDGPSAGLGRQHKMSRVAIGWVPTAIASGNAEAITATADDGDDDMEGLSEEQLRLVQV